jgi:hypothetical protein
MMTKRITVARKAGIAKRDVHRMFRDHRLESRRSQDGNYEHNPYKATVDFAVLFEAPSFGSLERKNRSPLACCDIRILYRFKCAFAGVSRTT